MKKSFAIVFALIGLVLACASGPGLVPLDQQAGFSPDIRTGVDLGSIYFDSRDADSKSVVGAIPLGQEVVYTITARKGNLSRVLLRIDFQEVDGNNEYVGYYEEADVEFTLVSTEETPEGAIDTWQGSYTFGSEGVYGYYFELFHNDSDYVVLANNTNRIEVPYVSVQGTGGLGQITGPAGSIQHYIQTVYLPEAMEMPQWADEMVVYYIFPDRFKNGNKANDPQVGVRPFYDDKPIEFHTNWNDPKPWVPGATDGNTEDDAEWNNDFYGGDLDGIIAKLDHIQSLGANVLYINPIFFAPSNHKYDTADYKQIDPAFGDLATFRRLATEAKSRGIRIILDASLNHSGSDSVYMDRFGKYDTLGAFENETVRVDSPYYGWYEFTGASEPDQAYRQWANPTLANLQESDSWKDFAFRDADSVTKFWLDQGASGWRMDVVPWVSDEFWMEWRESLNETHPEAITFAEVWFDASKYLYGDKFHSTMNYIFRGAVLDLANKRPVEEFVQAMEMMQEHYPPQVLGRLMNLVSSHDVPRAFYEIGYKNYGQNGYEEIKSRYELVPFVQFTLPGAPTIYYGDEIGLTGGKDPYCRGPFPWIEDGGDYGDWSLLEYFQKLGSLRQEHKAALVHGDLEFLYAQDGLLIYRRGKGQEALIMVLNNSESPVAMPTGEWLGEKTELISDSAGTLTEETLVEPYSHWILR